MDKCAARMFSEYSTMFIEKLNSGCKDDPEFRLYRCRVLESRCSLCKNRGKDHPVPSFGTYNAKVLILDSNPGEAQVIDGSTMNLSSATAKMLLRILDELKLTLQDCFITYSFHCKSPKRESVAYDKCSLWLSYELSLLTECNIIITLGEDPFHMIMGEGYPRVVDIMGNTYSIEVKGKVYKVVPLMHPWFLLRNPDYMQKMYDILEKVR